MEPEISRRCPDCGAAFRVRAAFCPNCGRPTGSVENEEQQQQQPGATGIEHLRETAGSAPAAVTSEHDSALMDKMDAPPAEATDRAHPKRHRVRAAAREAVEENLLPRVERIRQASNVVLDEAAYDPSLRFVLIALTLFFIFLVILLANNILG